MPNPTRQELIEALRRFPFDLEALVTPLTDAQLDQKVEGEWTVRQIVHHILDSHGNAVLRFKRPLTEERPVLGTYEQDLFALLPDYRLPLAPSLAALHGLHAHFVALLEGLTDEQWSRTGVHPQWGEVSVYDIAHRYAAHGENHIAQINRVLLG